MALEYVDRMAEDRRRIAERVRMALGKANLSHREAAEALEAQGVHVSRGTIQRLAQGERVRDTVALLRAIARMTDLPATFLLGEPLPWESYRRTRDGRLIITSREDEGASLDSDSDTPTHERISSLAGNLHDPRWDHVDPVTNPIHDDSWWREPSHTGLAPVQAGQLRHRLGLDRDRGRYGRRAEDMAG